MLSSYCTQPALMLKSATMINTVIQPLQMQLMMQEEPQTPATKDIVAEAAAAAAACDEEEGLQGAAAKAAARAASLGLAARSEGYASLGGVDDHVSQNIPDSMQVYYEVQPQCRLANCQSTWQGCSVSI